MSKLDEIEQRANVATAGPWSPTDDFIQKVEPPWSVSHDAIAHDVMRDSDRIFIAAAREDIPWLLQRVRSLEAGLREYGRHGIDCPARPRPWIPHLMGPCDCGLAALAGGEL